MNGVDKFRHYYQGGNSELKTRSKKGKISKYFCMSIKKSTPFEGVLFFYNLFEKISGI